MFSGANGVEMASTQYEVFHRDDETASVRKIRERNDAELQGVTE